MYNISKLVLVKAYRRILVNPADIPKTGLTTILGTSEFLTMSFGLQNADVIFQHFMGVIIHHLDILYYYIADIPIVSASLEHITHLRLLF